MVQIIQLVSFFRSLFVLVLGVTAAAVLATDLIGDEALQLVHSQPSLSSFQLSSQMLTFGGGGGKSLIKVKLEENG